MRIDRRFRRAMLIPGIALLLIGGASAPRPPLFLYNRPPSTPAGLYIYCGHVIRCGEIVAFHLPISVFDYARRRGEPTGLLLLKHVLAVSRGFVSTIDGELRVNGTLVGRTSSVDSAGRPLPQWRWAGVRQDGELLVGSSSDRSFDSHFLGPIRTTRCLASSSASRSIHPRASRPKLYQCAIDPATVPRLLCHSRLVTTSGAMTAKPRGGIRDSVVPDKSRG